MKYLTLVRHGQAEWKDAATKDFDRPLTRRGLAEAVDTARRLHAMEIGAPALLLTSPAARALQTAEALARELGLARRLVKRIDSLYLAPPDELESVIRGAGPRIGHLLLVGHNPGLGELALRLAPQSAPEAFATGAAFRVSFDARDWGSIGTASEATYETPGRFFDLWH